MGRREDVLSAGHLEQQVVSGAGPLEQVEQVVGPWSKSFFKTFAQREFLAASGCWQDCMFVQECIWTPSSTWCCLVGRLARSRERAPHCSYKATVSEEVSPSELFRWCFILPYLGGLFTQSWVFWPCRHPDVPIYPIHQGVRNIFLVRVILF
jgi:hypothetical protein